MRNRSKPEGNIADGDDGDRDNGDDEDGVGDNMEKTICCQNPYERQHRLKTCPGTMLKIVPG
ncbi:hypothetical protein [Flavitalea sp.]|nr:hypothetical protein [Flavitalea sp.]